MTALLLVLLAPLSAVLASETAAQNSHACCEKDQAKDEAHCTHTSNPTTPHHQPAHSCDCHLVPDDGDPHADAVALTSSTVTFGPMVAAQTNLQVDIPLAREPDPNAALRHLRLEPASQPLYLLNSSLLL